MAGMGHIPPCRRQLERDGDYPELARVADEVAA